MENPSSLKRPRDKQQPDFTEDFLEADDNPENQPKKRRILDVSLQDIQDILAENATMKAELQNLSNRFDLFIKSAPTGRPLTEEERQDQILRFQYESQNKILKLFTNPFFYEQRQIGGGGYALYLPSSRIFDVLNNVVGIGNYQIMLPEKWIKERPNTTIFIVKCILMLKIADQWISIEDYGSALNTQANPKMINQGFMYALKSAETDSIKRALRIFTGTFLYDKRFSDIMKDCLRDRDRIMSETEKKFKPNINDTQEYKDNRSQALDKAMKDIIDLTHYRVNNIVKNLISLQEDRLSASVLASQQFVLHKTLVAQQIAKFNRDQVNSKSKNSLFQNELKDFTQNMYDFLQSSVNTSKSILGEQSNLFIQKILTSANKVQPYNIRVNKLEHLSDALDRKRNLLKRELTEQEKKEIEDSLNIEQGSTSTAIPDYLQISNLDKMKDLQKDIDIVLKDKEYQQVQNILQVAQQQTTTTTTTTTEKNIQDDQIENEYIEQHITNEQDQAQQEDQYAAQESDQQVQILQDAQYQPEPEQSIFEIRTAAVNPKLLGFQPIQNTSTSDQENILLETVFPDTKTTAHVSGDYTLLQQQDFQDLKDFDELEKIIQTSQIEHLQDSLTLAKQDLNKNPNNITFQNTYNDTKNKLDALIIKTHDLLNKNYQLIQKQALSPKHQKTIQQTKQLLQQYKQNLQLKDKRQQQQQQKDKDQQQKNKDQQQSKLKAIEKLKNISSSSSQSQSKSIKKKPNF